MGIEAIGSIGTAMGSVAPALASFGEVMKAPLGNIVNEGPVKGGFLEGFRSMNVTDITTINPGGTTTPSPLGEILFQAEPVGPLNAADVVAEAESILAQVKIPEPKEVSPMPAWEVMMPQIEPMVAPWMLPGILPGAQPATEAQPQLQTATKIATETRIANQPAQAVAPAVSPALEEQEVEELIEEKIIKNETSVEEEETEVSELKDVVDEEVLNIRLEEFGSAVDIVGAEAKDGLTEIDGKRIVEFVPAETEANRSGLIKKQGPDGSRMEIIGAVFFKRFRSVKEAKEQIAAIITQKVPVKRAKEGIVVGYEAVARVLKYFFVKAKPAEQLVTRVVKKQRPVSIMSSVRPEVKEPRIEDLGLAEVFPKAA